MTELPTASLWQRNHLAGKPLMDDRTRLALVVILAALTVAIVTAAVA
jgi:hypothetical protein